MSYDAGDKFNSGFHTGFMQGRAAEQIEHAQALEATRPFRGNDPALMRPTQCRVLRAFWVEGKSVEVGEVVTLARHDADSLRATGRVEIL